MSPFSVFQDLQAEIESQQNAFESLNSTGHAMTRSGAGSGGGATVEGPGLQRRLEEMNQRWVRLRTKSVEIR